MRASCLVISAEPIQECSTSPAGNGPAWHVQSCSRKDAALYRAHCVRGDIISLFSLGSVASGLGRCAACLLHDVGEARRRLSRSAPAVWPHHAWIQAACKLAQAQQHQTLESDGALGIIAYRDGPLQFLAQAQLLPKRQQLVPQIPPPSALA